MSNDAGGRITEASSSLIQVAKDAVDNQSSARDWGREAIRLITEDGHSVEGVIAQTKQALAWHHMSGLMDTNAKRSKFNNYFSTIRYLVTGWACGAIPISKRDDVLCNKVSFLYIYAHQRKLEKEEATSFDNAVERLTRVTAYAQDASPTTALRLKGEVALLLEVLERKAPHQLSRIALSADP
ncbi:hypothetical protein ASE69_07695 [Sphingomonas sp. Leaf208]|uniref:hypothetical protein n=1 Tax=Sphingomonas sp. Leaf208 TaxID=1735679 RepID=UPI0006F62B0A|nr:hypothetical protein [Sphingomonas sp. Leaf208]KQM51190.1 hypothetical protein ASE69_07695 [Sphingomonas sp. Leaf208]